VIAEQPEDSTIRSCIAVKLCAQPDAFLQRDSSGAEARRITCLPICDNQEACDRGEIQRVLIFWSGPGIFKALTVLPVGSLIYAVKCDFLGGGGICRGGRCPLHDIYGVNAATPTPQRAHRQHGPAHPPGAEPFGRVERQITAC
jgi:hypothetical protein